MSIKEGDVVRVLTHNNEYAQVIERDKGNPTKYYCKQLLIGNYKLGFLRRGLLDKTNIQKVSKEELAIIDLMR